jgi:hypothetical protein
MGNLSQRLPLFNTLEYGCPGRGRDLPARIRNSWEIARQGNTQRMIKGKRERISS